MLKNYKYFVTNWTILLERNFKNDSGMLITITLTALIKPDDAMNNANQVTLGVKVKLFNGFEYLIFF